MQNDPVMAKYVAWVEEYTARLRRTTADLARLELNTPEHFWAISEQAFILGEIGALLAMMELETSEQTLH